MFPEAGSSSMNDVPDQRRRVLSLLRRHGRATTSFQALGPAMRHLFFGDDACVAYVDTGVAWVAAGPPIGAENVMPKIANRFLDEARRAGMRGCFVGVDRAFCEVAQLSALAIGEEPLWDLEAWPSCVRAHRGLREQIRRARNKDVVLQTVAAVDLAPGQPNRIAVESIIAQWLASRPLAPLGFLVAVEPFEFVEERFCVVAKRAGQTVAFLSAVPVYAERGFFVEHLLRAPDAPNVTAELVLDYAFREFAARGMKVATLGLAPLSGEDVGPVLKTISRLSGPFYSFEGLRAFKARLHPSSWRSSWLGHPAETPAPVVLSDVLTALTGGLLRFGLRTLYRLPKITLSSRNRSPHA
jgi:phosphatidylglycerol lysyltransferase